MLGWLRDDADRASLSKRRTRSTLGDGPPGRILMATSRPRRESLARKTCPIPPKPSAERIVYWPNRTPGDKDAEAPAGCCKISVGLSCDLRFVGSDVIEGLIKLSGH